MDKKVYILIPGHKLFGHERALFGYAELLSDMGHAVSILGHKGWGEEIRSVAKAKGFEYHGLSLGTLWDKNIWSWIVNIVSLPLVFIKLTSIVASHDIVIAGNVTFGSKLLPLLYVKKRITLIFRHGDRHADHTWLHRGLSRLIFCRADAMFANSSSLQAALVAEGYSVELIRNFVDMTRFTDLKRQRTVRVDKMLTVGYIGQIAVHKGINDFLSCIESEVDGCKFIVVGESNAASERDFYESIVDRLSRAPNSEHLPFLRNVQDVLESLDVLVCLSRTFDPSPNVVIEAKVFGVPAIVTNTPGLNEMVSDQVDGYVIDVGDVSALTRCITTLRDDPDLLMELSRGARMDHETRYTKRLAEQKLRELIN